jgi:hypothetical protein
MLLESIMGFLIGRTSTSLISISNETGGSNIGSRILITCLTKIKPIDVINFTS